MADENNVLGTGNENDVNDTPTAEEMKAEIERLKSEIAKGKTERDAALKKAGDATKALRAKQSAEEREAEEKAERERLAEEEKESLKKELNHIKAVNAYKAVKDEGTIETLIGAVSDGDHVAIADIMEKYASAKVKEAQAEWLKSRPQPNTGKYSSMTKEQIMAIPDRTERMRAIAQNKDLF